MRTRLPVPVAESTRRVCVCVCAFVMYTTTVSNTADFLCVNSSVCQVVMMMIDALCAVMEQ